MSTPILDAPGVRLDAMTNDDVDGYLALEDEEMLRALSAGRPWRVRPTPRDRVPELIAEFAAGWDTKPPVEAGLAVRRSGELELVGRLTLSIDQDQAKVEIYILDRARHQGLGTDAATRICDFAVDEMGVASIWLDIEDWNVKSQGLARKLGFAPKPSGAIGSTPWVISAERWRELRRVEVLPDPA